MMVDRQRREPVAQWPSVRRSIREPLVFGLIVVCAVLSLLCGARASTAQDAPLWPDREQIEHFLKKAKVTERKKIGTGVTHPEKVTLELDGAVRHAAFKKIDEKFDNWRNEVAAYELDKLLGIGMVPPTVERSVGGRAGCLQLWVTGSTMDQNDIRFPDIERWRDQVSVMWLFDDLIANVDRHLNNAMASPGYRLMLIDHSRSFRDNEELRNDLNAKVDGTNARLWGLEPDAKLRAFPDPLSAVADRAPSELVRQGDQGRHRSLRLGLAAEAPLGPPQTPSGTRGIHGP